MLSDFNYHCPHCKHQLNNNAQVAFLVQYRDNPRSTLLLDKQPGVYGYKSTHNLDIANGDVVQFFCTSCEASLQSEKRTGFIELELWTEGEMYSNLYFSPICGERVTYVEFNGELMRFGSDFLSIMSSRMGKGA